MKILLLAVPQISLANPVASYLIPHPLKRWTRFMYNIVSIIRFNTLMVVQWPTYEYKLNYYLFVIFPFYTRIYPSQINSFLRHALYCQITRSYWWHAKVAAFIGTSRYSKKSKSIPMKSQFWLSGSHTMKKQGSNLSLTHWSLSARDMKYVLRCSWHVCLIIFYAFNTVWILSRHLQISKLSFSLQ